MAAVQRPKEEANNFEAMYNEKTWDEVKALVPNLPIAELVSELDFRMPQRQSYQIQML